MGDDAGREGNFFSREKKFPSLPAPLSPFKKSGVLFLFGMVFRSRAQSDT
jgi:hypothetical protein